MAGREAYPTAGGPMKAFTAKNDGPLLEALFEALAKAGMSRSAIRRLLEYRRVLVNDRTARHDTPLKAGDRVSFVGRAAAPPAFGLRIVHEDDAVIVVDKPAGLLSVATERERERTAYRAMNDRSEADGG